MILKIAEELNWHKINSKERLQALEEWWIFGNSQKSNVEKLYKLNVLNQAAIGLSSSDKNIFLRALTLISIITDEVPDASNQIQDVQTIKHVLQAVSSSKENFRLEGLNVLK